MEKIQYGSYKGKYPARFRPDGRDVQKMLVFAATPIGFEQQRKKIQRRQMMVNEQHNITCLMAQQTRIQKPLFKIMVQCECMCVRARCTVQWLRESDPQRMEWLLLRRVLLPSDAIFSGLIIKTHLWIK